MKTKRFFLILFFLFTINTIIAQSDSFQKVRAIIKQVKEDEFGLVELEDSRDNDNMLTIVDVEAKYPGGNEALAAFIKNYFKYPVATGCKKDVKNDLLILKFIVNKYGMVGDLKLLKESGTCPELIREAMRVIKLTQWIPGNTNGKFYSSYKTIYFSINSSDSGDLEILIPNVPVKIESTQATPSITEVIKPIKIITDSNKIESNTPKTMKPIEQTNGQGTDGPVNVRNTAKFPGGDEAFAKFLIKNFNIPKRCEVEGIKGYVKLGFIVDQLGNTSDFEVLDETKACPEFTEEAIRVLKMSKWIPGNTNGTFFKSYRILPINLNPVDNE